MTQPVIRFRLDQKSPAPPYRQLVEQVRAAVDSGRLQIGDQLPSVRDVVGQIAINPNTVQRAYRELERLGLAEGRLGLGTFVVSEARTDRELTDGRVLRNAVHDLVLLAFESGASAPELVRVFDETLQEALGSVEL